jgi:uncharacterized repeat protein (TIGR01451 family)
MRLSLMKILKRRADNYTAGLRDVYWAVRQLVPRKTSIATIQSRTWRPTQSVPFGMAMGFLSILIFTAVVPLTAAQSTGGGDCDDNAVIRCGVTDLNDLKAKYRENQQGNVQAVFAAFSIPNEAALDGMVQGRVTAANEVFVNDRLVATNATTAGRQNISNERGSSADMGGGFWQRAPSVSFADPNGSLDALVKMEGNNFKYAVILSCGNPVGATPVTAPAPPPPTPPQTPPPALTPPAAPAEQLAFEINKDVRIKGQTQWRQHVTIEAGDDSDRLEYRIRVRNTGQAALEDVVIRDRPPSGTSHTDFRLENDGQPSGDLFTTEGITVDSIARNEEEVITYSLLINPSTEACGSSRLRNVATARPDNAEEKQDDATVEVCREDEVDEEDEDEEVTPPAPTPPPPAAVGGPTPPPAPVLAVRTTKTALPATGVGSLITLFSITSLGGGLAHYLFSRRRY